MTPVEHLIRIPRTARYLVSGDAVAPREVWFLLHGYGQLAEDFLHSCRAAEAPGRLLVAPEGLSRFYGKSHGEPPGASWMTRALREEEIADYVGYLDAVNAAVGAPGVPRTVLGFSQGAATASRWAALGAVKPRHLICWAGDVAHDLPEPARTLAGVRLTLAFGERDRLITPERKAEFLRRVEEAGLAFELHAFSGGHRMDDDLLARLAGTAF